MGAKGMTLGRDLLAFGFGFALAVLTGWVAFPRALYVQRQQPLDFHHKTHGEKSGITQCDTGGTVTVIRLASTCDLHHTSAPSATPANWRGSSRYTNNVERPVDYECFSTTHRALRWILLALPRKCRARSPF